MPALTTFLSCLCLSRQCIQAVQKSKRTFPMIPLWHTENMSPPARPALPSSAPSGYDCFQSLVTWRCSEAK